jgi:Primase C terminal 1 (PriCT-1)
LRGFEIETPIAPASMPIQAVVKGNRNESLFEQCMREPHHCGDFDALLDVAHTRNALYEPPMSDQEVENIAKSAQIRTLCYF